MRLTVALLASACCALTTAHVRAQACCAGTGSGEIGLVGPCHDGGITTMLGYQHAVASYDAEGDVHRLRDASVDDITLTLAGGVRFLDRRLLLAAGMPVRLQHRRFGDERSTRVLPGDASVSMRGMLSRGSLLGFRRGDPSSYQPFVDLVVSVQAPTGRAPEDTRDELGADITGAGAWVLGSGIKLTSFLTLKNSVSLSLGWRHSFARDVAARGTARRVAAGEAVDARVAWAYVPSLFRSGGVFASFTYAGAARENGASVEGSTSYRTSIGAFVTTYLSFPQLELSFSLSLDALWPGGSSNVPFVGPALTVAVSRFFHRRWEA